MPEILVVDDEPELHVEIQLALAGAYGKFLPAFGITEARELLAKDKRPLVMAFIDLYFPGQPDDVGVDFIEEFVGAYPGVPCAALTGGLRQDHINAVTGSGATYICKFDLIENVREFAKRAAIARHCAEEGLLDAIYRFVHAYRLTDRQAEIVALVAQDLTLEEIASRLGIAAGTLRRHLAEIYAKAPGLERTDEIRRHIRLSGR